MALPALDDVRRHFAGARLAVAARAGLARVFTAVPGVDLVVPLASGGDIRKRLRADTDALRSGRFELAILLPNAFYAAWVSRRAGIPARWGYRTDFRGAALTRRVRRPRGTMHQGAYYQHLVHALGMASGPLRPHVVASDRDRIAGAGLLAREGWTPSSPLVGLAPGAAYGFAKQWPPDRFAGVARLLAGRGVWSVLVGLPADRDAGRSVVSAFERPAGAAGAPLSGRLVNLIGRTDIGELMGVMSHCASFVANDSGAAHLAAAIGLPVVAIFGPTDERIAAPLAGRTFSGTNMALWQDVFCRPCGLRECPIDHRCMKRIAPERAFEAVMEQLSARGVA